ncbi:hypothetical protein JCM8202_000151 [Rhodotorula sphaerocarpa]
MQQGGSSGSGLTAASSPEDHFSEQQRLQPIPPAAYGGDDDDLETPTAYSYSHGSMYTVPLQHYAYDDAAGPADDGGGGGEFQSPPGGGPSTASYAPDYVSPAYSYDSYDSTSEYHHGTLLASVESARWETQGAQFAGAAAAGLDHVDPSFDALYTPPAPPASYAGPSSVSSRPSTSRERPRTADSVVLPTSNGITHPIPSDDSGHVEVKPFIFKIFSMLSDPERYQDVILWDHVGEAFFVAHNDRFVNEVLREQFQHTNIHSFTRQLNVYQFQRYTVAQLRSSLDLNGSAASTYSGWTHPNFKRGRPDLLPLLTPRPSRARLIRKLEKQYSHAKPTPPPRSVRSIKDSPRSSGRRGSSAGTSSSHSSTKAGSDTSPPTLNQFTPLPVPIEPEQSFLPLRHDLQQRQQQQQHQHEQFQLQQQLSRSAPQMMAPFPSTFPGQPEPLYPYTTANSETIWSDNPG